MQVLKCGSGCMSHICPPTRRLPIKIALAAIGVAGLAFWFSQDLNPITLKAKVTLLLTAGCTVLAIAALATACIWYFCLRSSVAPSSMVSASAKQASTDAELFEQMVKIVGPASDKNETISQVFNCETEKFLKNFPKQRCMQVGKDRQGCSFILVQGLLVKTNKQGSVICSCPFFEVIYLNQNVFSLRGTKGLEEFFKKTEILTTLETLAKSKKIEKSDSSGKIEITIE